MNETLDHIRAYAPPVDAEPPDDDLLERIFDDDRPVITRARPRLRPVVAGAAAVVALAGVGTAAAAGPGHLWNRVFGSSAPSSSRYQADPATAHKVLVAPGPDGKEFAAWAIYNDVGWRCTATFFEPVGETTPPTALVDGSTAHGCGLSRPGAPGLFADGSGDNTPGDQDRLKFVWESGAAVRAELRVSTGAVYPVTVSNGWLGGWFTREQVPLGSTATIVAYDAKGTVLGRFTALDQFGCDDPAGC